MTVTMLRRPAEPASTANHLSCANPRNPRCTCPACLSCSDEHVVGTRFVIDEPGWHQPITTPHYGPDGRDMGRFG